MTTTGSIRPDGEWADSGTDVVDDELLLGDFDVDDEAPVRRADTSGHVPHWRRIEMSREDKNLKWAMADFEDYDDFEEFVEL
jgi:hypothetical protein